MMADQDAQTGAATAFMGTRGIDRASRLSRGALVSVLALCGVLGWGATAVLALPIAYVALGDSVASGYGLADDETACHQSMLAYPWSLYARLHETFIVPQFDLLACSGTTTRTLDGQVSEVLSCLSAHPTLITLTVGANDFGWSDVFAFAQNLCTPNDEAFDTWVAGIRHRAYG
jgi:lysophospholipase L1-like esterase